MLSQYPHIILFKTLESPAPSLKDGEWDFGDEDDNPLEMECRAESNSNGGTIGTRSGQVVNYSYTVYMPKADIDIAYGTACTLIIDGKSDDYSVKWVSKGQFNTRVWL